MKKPTSRRSATEMVPDYDFSGGARGKYVERYHRGTKTGRNGDYKWLVAEPGGIAQLLDQCPSVLLEREIAITSFDSGPLTPTPGEQARGWNNEDDVLYIPSLPSVSLLPYDNHDEWYLFEKPCRLTSVEVFVSYSAFTIALEPHINGYMQPIVDRFWTQLLRIRPESYVGDGDFFIFATCNRKHYDLVSTIFNR